MSYFPPHSAASVIAALLFTAFLVLACISDARTRRIPNGIVLLLAVGGLAHSLVREPGAAAFPQALAAMALGLVIWLPFHTMRMLGAGDVKLFAAASAWLSPLAAVNAALVAALAGGLLSLAWMLRSHGGAFTVVRVTQMASVAGVREQVVGARDHGADGGVVGGGERARGASRLPYGIAMAIGLLATVWLPYHLL